MKRTGPARVAALAAKDPPALRITVTGGDLTPAASRAIARLIELGALDEARDRERGSAS